MSLSLLNSATASDGFSREITTAGSQTLEAHSTTLKEICLGHFIEHLECTSLLPPFLSLFEQMDLESSKQNLYSLNSIVASKGLLVEQQLCEFQSVSKDCTVLNL